jgi:hypothetical protein
VEELKNTPGWAYCVVSNLRHFTRFTSDFLGQNLGYFPYMAAGQQTPKTPCPDNLASLYLLRHIKAGGRHSGGAG